jgi:hypothetical protein
MSAIARVKAHFAAVGGGIGGGELADSLDDGSKLLVMIAHARIELGEFGGSSLWLTISCRKWTKVRNRDKSIFAAGPAAKSGSKLQRNPRR